MPRLLLLLPTTTYRAEAFLDAARKLKLDVVVGSKRAAMLEDLGDAAFLPLKMHDLEEAVRSVLEFARTNPIDVVVGVDDHTTVVAAVISAALRLPHNPVTAVAAARNKHRMRELLHAQGLPVPRFALFSVDDDPAGGAGAWTRRGTGARRTARERSRRVGHRDCRALDRWPVLPDVALRRRPVP